MSFFSSIHAKSLICAVILSSKYIFEKLTLKPLFFSLSEDRIQDRVQELLFIELRRLNPYYPDHMYKNLLDATLGDEITLKGMIFQTFKHICEEYLHWMNNDLYVKRDKFKEWHNLTTLILSIQPIVFFLWQLGCSEDSVKRYLLPKNSLMLSYYDITLDSLITDLVDLHVHINGVVEPEYVLLDALASPHKFYREFKIAYDEDRKIREFSHQFDIFFTPVELYFFLRYAKCLREFLIMIMKFSNNNYKNNKHNKRDGHDEHNDHNEEIRNNLLEFLVSKWTDLVTFNFLFPYPYKKHPYEVFINLYPDHQLHNSVTTSYSNIIVYEALFLYDCFQFFKNHDFPILPFYIYILICNIFKRFIVHQIDQYGFEQFHKIVRSGLREVSEKEHQRKFHQLNSFYSRYLSHVECRIAPKKRYEDTAKRLKELIDQYEKFKDQESKHQSEDNQKSNTYSLSIIIHFIKESDIKRTYQYITYRHQRFRKKIKRIAYHIVKLLKEGKNIREYVRGIDAAGDELGCPPEVFAPTIRFLRKVTHYNILHDNNSTLPTLRFTYHVGEDFIHLISGIRSVYEAIIFLNLDSGDRLSHATAVGIDPDFWLRQFGSRTFIKKGEWLDNLIFCYHVIRKTEWNSPILYQLEKEICKLFSEIYLGHKDLLSNISRYDLIDILIESYHCRALDPEYYFLIDETIEPDFVSIIDNHLEYERINFEEKQPDKILGFYPREYSLRIFNLYHQGDVIRRYNDLIEVDLHSVLNRETVEILKMLQNYVVKLIKDRNIAVEVMLTSNVRISQYNDFKMHHIFKWLLENEPQLNVVLCSDDPGIFNTNLRNEYLLTAQILRELNRDPIPIIGRLKHNSKVFKFRAI